MNKSVEKWKKRREERLRARGIRLDEKSRFDAPNNNNNNGGGEEGGGGGASTRLPYGIAKSMGLDTTGMSPSEVWAMLGKSGISAKEEYRKLKERGGGGKEEAPPPPPPPKRSVTTSFWGREETYDEVTASKGWSGTAALYGIDSKTGRKTYIRRFESEADMMAFLKKQGVEEFESPYTGEVLNPKESDAEDYVYDDGDRLYKKVDIGYVGGRYAIKGTTFEGKKKSIHDFATLEAAKEYLDKRGMKEGSYGMSRALLKRETERTSWLTSDKKEYIEVSGGKVGDLRLEDDSGYYSSGFVLRGEKEDGSTFRKSFSSKAEAMRFLKDQGVEKVKVGKKEFENPTEYEVPEVVATIRGKEYAAVRAELDETDMSVTIWGTDLDGRERRAVRFFSEWGTEDIEKDAKSFGVDLAQLKGAMDKESADAMERVEEKAREKSAEMAERKRKEEEERRERERLEAERKAEEERKKAEFAAKEQAALSDPEYQLYPGDGHVYKDMYIEKPITKYGSIILKGTDVDGEVKEIGMFRDMESAYDKMEDAKLNYEVKSMKQYTVESEVYGGKVRLHDVEIKKIADEYHVRGFDQYDSRKTIQTFRSKEDAEKFLQEQNVDAYKYKDASDREFEEMHGNPYDDVKKPVDGIRRARVEYTPDGKFAVYADTRSKGAGAHLYTAETETEARKWLEDNGVDASKMKIRKPVPNDKVPRNHSAKSLAAFDQKRREALETLSVSELTSEEQEDLTSMVKDMFEQGEYKMSRTPERLEDIFDGGFKNLLETGTSGGSSYKPGRRATEERIWGIPDDMRAVPAADREKYGYWGYSGEDSSDSGTHYGKMEFTFKKDRVAERTTFTFGDTLDARAPSAGYAGANPTIEGCACKSAGSLRNMISTYKRYKEGKMSFADFHYSVASECTDSYVELQFHGKLTLDDVADISFPSAGYLGSAFDEMSESKRKQVYAKIVSSGINVRYKESGKFVDGLEWLRKRYTGIDS